MFMKLKIGFLAFVLSAILVPPGRDGFPPNSPDQLNREHQPVAPSYSLFKQHIEAKGWRMLDDPPQFPPVIVVEVRKDGRVTALPKDTELRYSWVVPLDPVHIPRGKEVNVRFEYGRGGPTARSFTLAGGRILHVSELTAQPVRAASGKEATGKMELTVPAEDKGQQAVAFLQQRIDLVADGKILESWYCRDYAVIRFRKPEDSEK